MELLSNQHRRPVNDVSFGSVGRICVTPASHFSRAENCDLILLEDIEELTATVSPPKPGHMAMVKIQFDAVPHVSLFLVL
jgi:hypothetical protein